MAVIGAYVSSLPSQLVVSKYHVQLGHCDPPDRVAGVGIFDLAPSPL
jgi:hypothetical protein